MTGFACPSASKRLHAKRLWSDRDLHLCFCRQQGSLIWSITMRNHDHVKRAYQNQATHLRGSRCRLNASSCRIRLSERKDESHHGRNAVQENCRSQANCCLRGSDRFRFRQRRSFCQRQRLYDFALKFHN